MYFKFNILLFLLHLLGAQCFNIFSLNNAFQRLVKQFESLGISVSDDVDTKWIDQSLDHFDSTNTRTWKMRYFQRLDYWQPNGPIYLFIGGEAEANPAFLSAGIICDLAAETNGAMFMSEHRYYGQSKPVEDYSNVEDMKYLTAAQALADIATLLESIKKNDLYKNSKIVVIGGSYPGNLAAWMRLEYPNLVNAAISSSGPVEAKRDFSEYLEIVSRDFENYGTSGCLDNIKNKFQRYDSLFQSSDGIEQLKKDENICENNDMTKPENKDFFFFVKAAFFMETVQYATVQSIQDCCSKLSKTDNVPVQINGDQYLLNGPGGCSNYEFDNFVNYVRQSDHNMWSWFYQTCTEFGYFQSTTSNNQPFTANIPVEWYDKTCTALFGEGFNKDKVENGVKETNGLYGGKSPNVTEVVFVNGDLDPWSALSILKDVSDDAPAIYIPKSSHCAVLYPKNDQDPDELKEGKEHTRELIKKWIM